MTPPRWTYRTTYDIDAPWIAHHDLMPDWLCWLIGFAVVQTECAICGERQRAWKRLWWPNRQAHVEARKARLHQHRHPRMAYRPLYWYWPMENYQAWRRWRADRASLN